MDLETRLKKAHVALMRHPETAFHGGVMMMGTSTVIEDDTKTAYTDGVNKAYGRKFCTGLTDPELNALVLHENLHVELRHLIHNRDLFLENRSLANQAGDYVVNSIIVHLKDKALCKLPAQGLYDIKYKNMSMREVYRALKKKKEDDEKDGKNGDKGQPGDGDGDGGYEFDDHDIDGQSAESPDEVKKLNDKIDKAIREGTILAGRLGTKIPRAITESLEPKVDWRDELAEFVTSTTKGNDEYTWRRYNRRVIDWALMPTVENEKVGEIIVPIDTSGSIGERELAEFAGELASICEAVNPDSVRVLWWDTMVHAEQVFTDNYSNLATMLKPVGGGGTVVGSVAKYINDKKLAADCVIVFTDGYVESDIKWDISTPTLWMVTANRRFNPPTGKTVRFE